MSDELLRRQDRLLERRHKQARFRDADRSLDAFDFDFNKKMNRALIHELATGRFIGQREDALFLGPPGTGKSHLAQAIGRAVIQQGYRVLYREAHTLLEELADATLDGTRKTFLADLAAARAQGWVRQEYLPFVASLADAGFEVSPNLVFRTLTGVGKKRIRFKDIDRAFWDEASIKPVWERTKRSWSLVLKHLRDKGIAGNALLPSDNALVSLTALADRFPDDPFDSIFYWFVQASRLGRYSTSSTSSMEEDLKEIAEAVSLKDALERLLGRIRYLPKVTTDDFLRDFGDSRSGRMLLYLLIQRNAAVDWDLRGMRIGFDSVGLLSGFAPQFHHIFPKAFIGDAYPRDLVNALANIALIGPAINIRISKKDPMDYVQRYAVTPEKLQQQHIDGDLSTTPLSEFPAWLNRRAEKLAAAANDYLASLRGDLTLPAVVATEEASEHAYAAD